MRRPTIFKAFALIAIVLMIAIPGQPVSATTGRAEEHFSVREYNLFHAVLHPLQHEALPKKDFKTIRSSAARLVARGRDIIRLGIPVGVEETTEFEKHLKQFRNAIDRFEADAKKRSNARLEESYNAVHDSFEMLASLLPRN